MRFIFVHTEGNKINLEHLYTGTERGAGSVARCRLLFWLAARGNEVYAVGNVEDSETAGVHGKYFADNLPSTVSDLCGEDTLIVFNNFPKPKTWDKWKRLKRPGVNLAVWAGNPFVPAEWMKCIISGELDRIVCVSKTHRDWYRIYRGFEKIEYSYSGVDTDLIANSEEKGKEDRTILFLSIPRKTKGFHHLLTAWKTVRERVPDAVLHVCGKASMHDPEATIGKTGILDMEVEEEFPDLFADYPESNRRMGVELLGSIDMTDVHAEIKSAAVAVVNCNWRDSVETYCRAAVEAQVAGTPVVGANRGSLQEVVCNGVTGSMVDREDTEALADAIVQLLMAPSRRLEMGRAGKDWAMKFADYAVIAPDWEAIAQRAKTGEPAPSGTKFPDDLLRKLGYGYLRMGARYLREKLQGSRG